MPSNHSSLSMHLCPLDYRYGDQSFKRIWSDVGRHERQLEVERALIWAHCELGRVSKEDYEAVAAISNPTSVTIDRVAEIEADTPEDAEKKVENELSKFMGNNKHISDELGARAIQGKAYLPGPDDKDEIIENED